MPACWAFAQDEVLGGPGRIPDAVDHYGFEGLSLLVAALAHEVSVDLLDGVHAGPAVVDVSVGLMRRDVAMPVAGHFVG